MKIAIITFAHLPIPSVSGGAIETLITNICDENEIHKEVDLDIYSIHDNSAEKIASSYKKTKFHFYQNQDVLFSVKNIFFKLFKIRLLSKTNRHLIKKINTKKYDFVIITAITYDLLKIIPAIKSPVIWYLHADPLSVLPTRTVHKICKKCNAILAVSNFIASRVQSFLPENRIKTVVNCSDIKAVKPINSKDTALRIRSKYGISLNSILLTYVGRITKIKGIYELIQAFRNTNLKDAKLLIVGCATCNEDNKYLYDIKKIATNDVIFTGYINHADLHEIYCASDSVIIPSICFEAAGLSVLEPQLCGVPVIATHIGGIPEYCFPSLSRLIPYDEHFVHNLALAINEVKQYQYINKHDIPSDYQNWLPKSYYFRFLNSLHQLTNVKTR